MIEHLIGLIQDFQSKCETYKSAFDPVNKKHKDPSYYRVNRPLDALADVLVSEESEVFAVVARMAPDKLTLTIASNANMKESTIKHIQRIWEYLNVLGDDYARIQRQQECSLIHDGDDDKEEDEDAPPPTLQEMFEAQRLIAEDFKRYMYEHSLQKLLQRLHGGSPERTGFESLKLVKDSKLLSKKSQQSLDKIVEVLNSVFELLAASSNELPREDFGDFSLDIDLIDVLVRDMFDHCVDELHNLDYFSNTQTVCYLKEITSLTSSIGILLMYAISPHLRSRFLYGKCLEIEYVPSKQCNLELPSRPGDYEQIAKPALTTYGSYWTNEGKPGHHIMQHYHANPDSTPVVPAPVHCECALISYLLKGNISPPPFSYIGTSELSCFPCWKFLECLRKDLDVNYQVRGTHNESHWPWKYPRITGALYPDQAKKVQDSFYREIARRYTEYILRIRQEKEWEAERPSLPSLEELGRLFAGTCEK